MVFVVPVKRVTYTRLKRFSQYVDIDESGIFVLQKRKNTKSNSGRPNYRILTKGNPYYEMAYGNDLSQMRDREWKYFVEQIPKLMPPDMNDKTQLVWIIAHITCRAIDVDGARDLTTSGADLDRIEAERRLTDTHDAASDDDGDADVTPAVESPVGKIPAAPTGMSASSPASNAAVPSTPRPELSRSKSKKSISAAAAAASMSPGDMSASTLPSAIPAIVASPTKGRHHHHNHHNSHIKLPKGSTLVPVSTWPLRGIVPFLLLIAATNMPALLMREATSKTFLATLAVLNICLFLAAIVGVPASFGVTILQRASSLTPDSLTALHGGARALLLGSSAAAATDSRHHSHHGGSADEETSSGRPRRGSTTASEGESSSHVSSDDSDSDGDDSSVPTSSDAGAARAPGIVAGANNFGKPTDVTAAGVVPGLIMKAATDPSEINAFADPQGESWAVRCGPNYKKNKQKSASAPCLFDLVGMDVFRSDKKIVHVGQHIDIAAVRKLKPAPYISLKGKFDKFCAEAKEAQAKTPCFARAPNDKVPLVNGTGANTGGQVEFDLGSMEKKLVFLVNFSLPIYQPSMMSAKGDGETLTLVWYLVATDDTQRELLRADGPQLPAVKLLKRLAESDFNSKEGQAMMLRMKALPRLVNADDFDFGWALRKTISQYNGKPFLTRPQHQIFRGDGYMEYFLDVHNFCYMARNVVFNFLPKMEHIVLDWGFTIEAYDDEEQPEVILGNMRLFKPNLNPYPSWEATLAALKKAKAEAAAAAAAAPVSVPAPASLPSDESLVQGPSSLEAGSLSPMASSLNYGTNTPPGSSLAAPMSNVGAQMYASPRTGSLSASTPPPAGPDFARGSRRSVTSTAAAAATAAAEAAAAENARARAEVVSPKQVTA